MSQYDFKKEWPKIKRQLVKFSKDALVMARKGEDEFIRFSKTSFEKGKLHVGTTALNLKKEHLCQRIGKEYVKAGFSEPHTPQLKKLMSEYSNLEKELLTLEKQIKGRPSQKKKKSERTVNQEIEVEETNQDDLS